MENKIQNLQAYVDTLEKYNRYLLDYISRIDAEDLDTEDVKTFEEFLVSEINKVIK